ncbi:SurA N-terminal domain-containing protein [Variovorax sp. PCZ-1]|uniref:SurA N-terminal domain-containing protein n=1 Tax=Variovorax sp. PCZ-1 TaxID=2835533 RepID=UPI001BCA90CC|nr:SurA N-terminal domain-containing protein [Variovorax sp. PCZ-1]MBS7808257.1 SurA N-terminal domain-containing protein [Variovorax sp. PCZ-1]
MFDYVRKHTRVMQFLLFLLIFPAFALVGIDGYTRFNEKGTPVASVDGQDIRQPEWDEAHKQEVERLRQSMPNLDPKLLDSPEAKYATLERLVRERVMAAAAAKQFLTTSDQRLAKDLSENPSIAALRKSDGSLDIERYKQLVGAQGLSPEGFENRVRQDLSMRQVLAGVNTTGLNSAALIDQTLAAYFERRDIQVQRFSTAEFAAKATPTDEQLDQFYKTNPQLFQAPESASIEYVVLDLEAAKKGITLKAEDVKAYYDQNAARLSGQEERRASHILITAPKNAPAAERSAAKAKAEALLAEVKAKPDSFADVAKKNSQDPGSAASGGDLDFFARGAMVKPFEDAAFGMQKGEIGSVVESDFGYHIIRLTDIKAAKQKTFEEMKPEIEADLLKQQAQKKFAELAEGFTNAVYEQAESLKPAADRLGLQVKTVANIQRIPGPGVTGPLANTRFLNALFSADSVEKKRNTEAVETGASQMISGRIVQYTAARTLPLAEVKDRVRERVVAQLGAELAKKEGQAKLATWQANPASATLPEAVIVSREQTQRLPTPIIEAALRADATKLPVIKGVDLGAQGYAVLRVNKVMERDTKGANVAEDRKQVTTWWTNAEALAYYEALKTRFKVEFKVAKPVPKKDDLTASTQ